MIEEILNLIFRQVNPIKLVSRLTKFKRINSRWHNFVIMNKLARRKISAVSINVAIKKIHNIESIESKS